MIVVPLLLRFHRWSLLLYPAAFRAEFGEEMEAVFDTALTEAGRLVTKSSTWNGR